MGIVHHSVDNTASSKKKTTKSVSGTSNWQFKMDDLKLLREEINSYVYDDTDDGGTVIRECVFNGFNHLDLSLLSQSQNIRQPIRYLVIEGYSGDVASSASLD